MRPLSAVGRQHGGGSECDVSDRLCGSPLPDRLFLRFLDGFHLSAAADTFLDRFCHLPVEGDQSAEHGAVSGNALQPVIPPVLCGAADFGRNAQQCDPAGSFRPLFYLSAGNSALHRHLRFQSPESGAGNCTGADPGGDHSAGRRINGTADHRYDSGADDLSDHFLFHIVYPVEFFLVG